jgi:Animal haem peroxidase
MPISVPSNDACYGGNVTCLNYIRSFRSFDQCNLSVSPLPVNFHTPWIDLELVYNPLSWEHLLENNGFFDANNTEKMKHVLVGYDARSMQLPGLFLYLMYFVKFHNVVIPTFKRRFGNEKGLFETRKLVTAVYQRLLFEMVAFNMG